MEQGQDSSSAEPSLKRAKSERGGRPLGPLWQFFTAGGRVNSSQNEAHCNFCNNSVRGVKSLMLKHIQVSRRA